jgi:phosphatidylserine decarboxylase
MKPHQTRLFLRGYGLLPQAAINRCALAAACAERPAWAVQLAIRLWARRLGIDAARAPGAPFRSLQAFFLRGLAAGARPLGEGFVSPVDARVLACGPIEPELCLRIKGHVVSLAALLGGPEALAAVSGGTFAVLFLSPDDYHHVHMPEAGRIVRLRWIPGRYFPQNEAALRHIPRVHAHNERLVLHAESARGDAFVLVMVAASLVGGIHLAAHERSSFARAPDTELDWQLAHGERLGHFAFGSTVLVFVPGHYLPSARLKLGGVIRMGETLFVPRPNA